ncbi:MULTISPECIES: PTS sugar transporter subunit IIC [unclassified Clostridium]|uniref:PTS sugar transporter subunit IIC n=1 Tax=unclassified Clostridium TaxID=2614128 RepID=UPI0025C44CDB|nr:PTS transporter subunit EIIC [Clostridium sp.]MDY2630643.1 PTS transporter subunit EIIC [Clostridium sp.]MDY4251428.1 PTS transporter subunit EIIC [Clostridium sp.]MDY6228109.1 PTS transporter subunit EIIC [Clostridium sp.]
MNKLMETIEKYLLPIASKISNQKFLIALRDSFIGTMPVVMTGSIALLLNAFLVDVPGQFGNTSIPQMFSFVVDINNLIFKGSLAIVSLLFIFSLGVNIAKIYNTDYLSSGIVALSAFIIAISNSITKTIQLPNADGQVLSELFKGIKDIAIDANNFSITVSGVIPGAQINSNGYFTAMIVGFMACIIFGKLMNKNWTIKLPDTVPPAIAKPFLSIIPGFIALYSVSIFVYVFNKITGQILIDWIYKVLQTPLLGLSQSFLAVVLIAFLTQLFWFFGIHGGNVMAPIMEGLFGVTLLANMEAFQNNQSIPYLWTSVSYGSFVWYGTLGLLIAIFWKSRNSHYKEVAKLGIAPVLFNIGEPVMYGLPTVMNPLLFIPFLLSPSLMAAVSYLATSLGWVAPVTQNVTWVMPPVLYGFFSTGFDWRAIVLSLVNLAISIVVYLPFVKMADKEVV